MVGRAVVHQVVGVEQGFLDEAAHVVVVGSVEDASSFSAGAHQAAQAQLREMLRDRRRPRTEVVSELVDRVLAMEEGPQDPQPGRVRDHREQLDGAVHLRLRRFSAFLRTHADRRYIAGRSDEARSGRTGRLHTPGGIRYRVVMELPEGTVADVTRRLRRIEGQVRGLQQMLAEGRDCREIVTQLSAANKALEQAGFVIVAAGLTWCLEDPERSAAEGYEVADVQRMFTKLA